MEVRLVGDWGDDAAYTWLGLADRLTWCVRRHFFKAHPDVSENQMDWVESSVMVTMGDLAKAWRSGERKVISWKCSMPQCNYRIDLHVLED